MRRCSRAGRKFGERIWAIEGCNGAGRPSRTGSWPTARRSWTCPRSYRRRYGSSPLATAARPTRSTRTRSRWPRCGPRTWSRSRSARTWWCWACWPTGATSSAGPAPRPSTGSTGCCWTAPRRGEAFLSAAQARALIAATRPRDIVGKTRRRLAAELITELEAIDRKIKACKKEIAALVEARGSTLLAAARHRPLQRSPAAGRRRQHPPVRQPGPLRVLERHRTPGRLLRPAAAPPALPRRATGGSTGPCTSWPSSSCATRPKDAPTTTPGKPPGKPRWKPCAASNDACPTSSTGRCSTTRTPRRRRAREGTGDDPAIQRDRPDPGHRLFGQATSRTRHTPA